MTTPGGHRRYDLDEVHTALGTLPEGSAAALQTHEPRLARTDSGPLHAFVGKWVALDSPTDVVAAADTPQDLLRQLDDLNREAMWGIVRIPVSAEEAEIVGAW